MTKEELAAVLSGREIGAELTMKEEADAKATGLVVVFGASDDLMEFRGAISDELGAYEGHVAHVDREGIVPEFESLEGEDEETFRAYFRRKDTGLATIEAVWNDTAGTGPAWTFRTALPHATFDVMEDGEVWCRGIVFALADLPTPGAPPCTP